MIKLGLTIIYSPFSLLYYSLSNGVLFNYGQFSLANGSSNTISWSTVTNTLSHSNSNYAIIVQRLWLSGAVGANATLVGDISKSSFTCKIASHTVSDAARFITCGY